MDSQVLWIIHGMPGVGKSTLAAKLAKDLHMPKLGKDELKEFLFDHIGMGDREWSAQLGATVSGMLYPFVKGMLRAGKSVLVESAFDARFAHDEMKQVLAEYPVRCIELYCMLDEQERQRRFIARNENGERHPGHVDHTNYAVQGSGDMQKYAPLRVGEYIEVDTADFGDTEYQALLQRLRQMLA